MADAHGLPAQRRLVPRRLIRPGGGRRVAAVPADRADRTDQPGYHASHRRQREQGIEMTAPILSPAAVSGRPAAKPRRRRGSAAISSRPGFLGYGLLTVSYT